MDFAKMPFGAAHAWCVINPDIHAGFAATLSRLYGMPQHKRHNPAPNPVSLMRADLPRLTRFRYALSPKADGTRFVLLLTTRGADAAATRQGAVGACHALMIDRGNKMYGVELEFTPNLYAGTLLDGELVQCNDGRWRFLVFDCVAVAGKSLLNEPNYKKRMDAARDVCDYLQPKSTDVCALECKRWMALRNFTPSMYERTILNLPYRTDGFVLTPLRERVRTGKQNSLLKWKDGFAHTIDAQIDIRRADPLDLCFALQLVDGSSGRMHEAPLVDWVVLEGAQAQDLFRAGLQIGNAQGQIVECGFVPEDQGWHILQPRTDKCEPNSLYTAQKTMQNLEEDIRLGELFEIAAQLQEKFEREVGSRGELPRSGYVASRDRRFAGGDNSAGDVRSLSPGYNPRSPSPGYNPRSPSPGYNPRSPSPTRASRTPSRSRSASPRRGSSMDDRSPLRSRSRSPPASQSAQLTNNLFANLQSILNSSALQEAIEKTKQV